MLWGYRDFCDFQDGGRRRLGFSRIRNFYGRYEISDFRQITRYISKTVQDRQ